MGNEHRYLLVLWEAGGAGLLSSLVESATNLVPPIRIQILLFNPRGRPYIVWESLLWAIVPAMKTKQIKIWTAKSGTFPDK